ncbi:MAG TPA: hypothetical protein DEF51_23740, partial [Myxococcales bacterium]|nr:hypothetical protein [Myxococcales bacterium]
MGAPSTSAPRPKRTRGPTRTSASCPSRAATTAPSCSRPAACRSRTAGCASAARTSCPWRSAGPSRSGRACAAWSSASAPPGRHEATAERRYAAAGESDRLRPMLGRWLGIGACVALLVMGCDDGEAPVDAGPDGSAPDAGPPDPPPPEIFAELEETGRFFVPNLEEQAHVVRTEMDVPHVYAANRRDAMRVLGFTMAADRFFQMDLTSRLSQGTLSELIGDAALGSDIENRQTGATYVTDLFLEGLTDEEAADLDAFADGVNGYIEAVRGRQLPPPKELELAFALLGGR